MLAKTNALVLKSTRFRESSLIVKVYSEEFGLQSLLVNGVHKPKSTVSPSLFSPMSLVHVALYKKQQGLLRVKEVHAAAPLVSIAQQPPKYTTAFFISEFILQCIREEEANADLFEFLRQTVLALEQETGSVRMFYLSFMVAFSRWLGFFPSGEFSNHTPHLNLLSGSFEAYSGTGDEQVVPRDISKMIFELMQAGYIRCNDIACSRMQRQQMMQYLLTYFRIHLDHRLSLKSHEVLQEVFDGSVFSE